ncbi:MAG: response regulator [Maribacter stanieri]
MKKQITVVIEDQGIFRELLIKLLSVNARYEIAGSAEDGITGLELCRKVHPHFVILDLQLPHLDGFEVATRLTEELPATNILALTSSKDDVTLTRILDLGFSGYVEKDAPLTVLETAMARVADGGTFFTPRFKDAKQRLARDPIAFPKILSRREQQVIQLVASGASNTEAARKLGISVRTAGNHRYNAMQKLDIHDVTDLVAFAIKHGFRKED